MLGDLIRAFLGTDTLPRMEQTMASVLEALQQLATQQTETSTAQQTAFTNLQAAITRLEQAVRDGDVSPEVQAAVDDLTRGFQTMTEDAQRADDGYEPTQETPDGAAEGTETADTTGESDSSTR